MFAREIAAMRMKSCARVRNAANVDANGTRPTTCMPTAAAIIGGTARTCERVVDLREVMAIDNERIDPERSDARGVRVHVPLQLGRPALAEAIDVDDRGEIGEDLVSCVVERLPDRSLGGLAIAHEHPHVERRREWALRRERDADPDRT